MAQDGSLLTVWLQRVPDGTRVKVAVTRETASAQDLVTSLLRPEDNSELQSQNQAQPLSCPAVSVSQEDSESNTPSQGESEPSPSDFRFIYKGQVLRPYRLLDDYNIQEEDTIYYYISQNEASPGNRNKPRQTQTVTSHQSVDFVSDVVNSPFLDSIANNPELLMMLMEANPAIRQLRERSPELHALFSDPQTLRDAFQAMRNPSVMREMMRHSDRALSNIDAMPGGFDALRQVYKEVHEPVWESLSEANTVSEGEAAPSVTYDVQSPESSEPFPQAWPINQSASSARPVSTISTTSRTPRLGEMPSSLFPFAFFGGGTSSPFVFSQPFASPSERYRRQIEDLVAMGFTDRQKCEEALTRHGGNLNQAIDDLLRQHPSPTNRPSDEAQD